MKITTSPSDSMTVTDIAGAIAELELDLEKSIHAQPIFKTVGMQILLIGLAAEAELKRHTASGPISVQVLKGSISFRTDETTQELTSGQLLTLEANIPHSVVGNERSIFLVTKSVPE